MGGRRSRIQSSDSLDHFAPRELSPLQTRPELNGSFGMVASTHWLASTSAMNVLERGGNAADAAVAAGFVMQIVEPHLCGPGGDLVALTWSGREQATSVICGQGVSPAAATAEHFAGLSLGLVPGSGPLAAVVPGAFDGWLSMLARWGTWELADVLAYAIHYAETGFPLLATTSAAIDAVRPLFLGHWPTSAAVWLDGTEAPAPKDWWRLPATGATYRRILAEATGTTREQRIQAARDAFYRGFVAEAIERFQATAWRDSSGEDHAGLLTGDDLAAWSASVEAPVSAPFADRYTVFKAGPWSQGPVLAQQVRLFDALGLWDHEVRSPDWVHLITEAAKLAFADREAWYGDPDHADVPLGRLLSADYARERAALVSELADLDLRPGHPDGRVPRLPHLTAAAGPEPAGELGEPTLGKLGTARGDTCHVDVVDRWGNLVSATPSGGWLQSSPVIPGLGFGLGTRAQMFYLDQGRPNSLRPGVRPRTTLTPSLVFRDGVPWMAMGTPGGDQQDQWQAAFLTDVVAQDRRGPNDLQAAIDAPLFHTTHFPASFYPRDSRRGELVMESRFPEAVREELTRRGHRVVVPGPWRLGRLTAVAKEGGRLKAAADPRSAQAYAVGR
ncbi:gamma-glutamyltransferase family protein [Actinomadura soli]|uniref:Gamma-glutamyltransferase family protein n=1 Tax=Actinomadura soli TaxID=2508997 RepID=A0A5C4JGG6_9ACTN|nr:gamma-glutamyltransferase family protein [Actinomadura soli]